MMNVFDFAHFGVSGSRFDDSAAARLAARVVPFVARFGAISCGCARGVDAVARPFAASVFRVSAFGVGRAAFARRSIAFIRALDACRRSVLFVFPSGSCPPCVVPSASSSACFCGSGSGSWASAAFAVGLGLPVVVFGVSTCDLPMWSGVWSPVSIAGVDGFLFLR
jgi:hypothetical protein